MNTFLSKYILITFLSTMLFSALTHRSLAAEAPNPLLQLFSEIDTLSSEIEGLQNTLNTGQNALGSYRGAQLSHQELAVLNEQLEKRQQELNQLKLKFNTTMTQQGLLPPLAKENLNRLQELEHILKNPKGHIFAVGFNVGMLLSGLGIALATGDSHYFYYPAYLVVATALARTAFSLEGIFADHYIFEPRIQKKIEKHQSTIRKVSLDIQNLAKGIMNELGANPVNVDPAFAENLMKALAAGNSYEHLKSLGCQVNLLPSTNLRIVTESENTTASVALYAESERPQENPKYGERK